jgi:hypothetical protein
MGIAVAGRQGERRRSATNTLITDFGNHTAQVANVIPPQRAGRIATIAGATDNTGWCAIDPVTFESKIGAEHPCHRRCLSRRRHAQIRILGQCAGQGLRARDCHAAIRRNARHAKADQYLLQPGGPGLRHLGRRRLPAEERLLADVEGAGGVSPADAPREFRAREADYAQSWFATVTAEVFG